MNDYLYYYLLNYSFIEIQTTQLLPCCLCPPIDGRLHSYDVFLQLKQIIIEISLHSATERSVYNFQKIKDGIIPSQPSAVTNCRH